MIALWKRVDPWTAGALVAAAAARALWYVLRFGVNVPFGDEWDYVGDRLDPQQMFAQHNEHRIPFTRLVLYLFSRFSDCNMRTEMFANWLVLLLLLAILAWEFRTFSTFSWLAFVPVAALVFTLRQWENLLWGEQITVSLCVMFAALCFQMLSVPRSAPRMAAALACAVCASFTFISGLLVWPVGLVQLLRAPRSGKTIAVWSVSAAAVLAAYFHGYVRPQDHPSPLKVFGMPREASLYFLANLGGAFAATPYLVLMIGAMLFVLSAILLLSGALAAGRGIAVPLMLFSFLTTLTLLFGRGGFGWEQALSSRYATMTALLPIGAWLLLCEQRTAWTGELMSFFVCALLIATADANVDALQTGNAWRTQREEMQHILLDYDSQPDAQLARLFPNAAVVRDRAGYLRQHHLSVFAHSRGDETSRRAPPGPTIDSFPR